MGFPVRAALDLSIVFLVFSVGAAGIIRVVLWFVCKMSAIDVAVQWWSGPWPPSPPCQPLASHHIGPVEIMGNTSCHRELLAREVSHSTARAYCVPPAAPSP